MLLQMPHQDLEGILHSSVRYHFSVLQVGFCFASSFRLFGCKLFYSLVKVVAIASNALESFKNDAKKMVVALVDMERAFVPPQHFIRLVQRRSVIRLM